MSGRCAIETPEKGGIRTGVVVSVAVCTLSQAAREGRLCG